MKKNLLFLAFALVFGAAEAQLPNRLVRGVIVTVRGTQGTVEQIQRQNRMSSSRSICPNALSSMPVVSPHSTQQSAVYSTLTPMNVIQEIAHQHLPHLKLLSARLEVDLDTMSLLQPNGVVRELLEPEATPNDQPKPYSDFDE